MKYDIQDFLDGKVIIKHHGDRLNADPLKDFMRKLYPKVGPPVGNAKYYYSLGKGIGWGGADSLECANTQGKPAVPLEEIDMAIINHYEIY